MNKSNWISFLIILLSLAFFWPQNTLASREGWYAEAGMVGAWDTRLGNSEGDATVLELGPGAHGAIGYNWGALGVRPSFYYANMDRELAGVNIPGGDENLFGGSLDLKIYFMDLIKGESNDDDFCFPYLVFGIGGYHLDPGIRPASGGDPGFGGNIAIGTDLNVFEAITLGIETGIRPMLFFTDASGSNDTYDLYIFDFMAIFTVHFN